MKQGRRKADSLEHRSLITLDADFATLDLLDSFDLLCGNAAAVYSTHKHTPDAPRLRLVVPLSRTVTGDEYQAAARKLAESLGIDLFDDTTYQPTRLMYWPSTSNDGVYAFDNVDGPFLDPDTLLEQYPDWRDTSYWPESARCAGIRQKTAARQGDPRTKTGMVVYDNAQFAFSNHATDPASGRLCNAFDLVRLHLYGDRDFDAEPDTPINRLPSYTAMTELAREDDAVKVLVTSQRLEKARADFSMPEDAGDWMEQMIAAGLTVDKRGNPEPTINNVYIILTHDPALMGVLAFNGFKDRLVAVKALPWRSVWDPINGDTWTDNDDSELRRYLELGYTITGKERIMDALNGVAHANTIHPIKDYLEALEWDGEERLDTLLQDYLGAEDTPYTRAVTRKAFTAAVVRVMRPGCKFDYILVLSGPQGRGKSTLISKMSNGWYTDSLAGIGTKEAYEGIQGFWLVELGELAAMKKTEIETIKNFISKQVDSYRAAYGRRVEEHPRQCVFFGTTNSTAFLRDDTGNRRFWPVRLQETAPALTVWDDLSQPVIDQLWAEAVVRYREGEPLTLPDDLAGFAREQQEQFTEDDPRRGLVEGYLETLLPAGWAGMSIADRRMWFCDEDGREAGTKVREFVSAAEVWAECFKNDPGKFPRQERNEVNAILRQLPDWKEEPGRQRCGPYGLQTRFKRVSENSIL